MRKKLVLSLLILLCCFAKEASLAPSLPLTRIGIASWYSETDPGINLHTANGEIFDDRRLTCASWEYPFGTKLRVTSLKNGKTVIVRVNDRGPAKRLGRLIDLTKGAFRKIAPLERGLIEVKVEAADSAR